jgi:hypothetical protein
LRQKVVERQTSITKKAVKKSAQKLLFKLTQVVLSIIYLRLITLRMEYKEAQNYLKENSLAGVTRQVLKKLILSSF